MTTLDDAYYITGTGTGMYGLDDIYPTSTCIVNTAIGDAALNPPTGDVTNMLEYEFGDGTFGQVAGGSTGDLMFLYETSLSYDWLVAGTLPSTGDFPATAVTAIAQFNDDLFVGTASGGLYVYSAYGENSIANTPMNSGDVMADEWHWIDDCDSEFDDIGLGIPDETSNFEDDFVDCFPRSGTGAQIHSMITFDLSLWIGTDAGIWVYNPSHEPFDGESQLFLNENFPPDIAVNKFVRRGETLLVLTEGEGILEIK